MYIHWELAVIPVLSYIIMMVPSILSKRICAICPPVKVIITDNIVNMQQHLEGFVSSSWLYDVNATLSIRGGSFDCCTVLT